MEAEYPTKNDLVILKRVRWSPLIILFLAVGFKLLTVITGVAIGDSPDDLSWVTLVVKAIGESAWGLMTICFIWTTWHLARQLEKSADAGKHLREVLDGE